MLEESAEREWCETCRERLMPEPFVGCPFCGTFLEKSPPLAHHCHFCQNEVNYFDRVIPFGKYVGNLRYLVLEMKKARKEPLVRAVAELVWEHRRQWLRRCRADVVIPVPMHWFYRYCRGMNNPDILAEVLAEKLELPLENRRVRVRRMTLSQRSVEFSQRKENVRNLFQLTPPPSPWEGKRVLLVDDVVTSGATCNALAHLLKTEWKVSFVAVVVVARAGRKQ
ncbi:MAG: phosphoribosyltransferase family protein [Planctomycetia bacterium]|nr:phosphoribosyltransferase family protein [Planctomycetia bacterium]